MAWSRWWGACTVYLDHAKKHSAPKTHEDRADFLWDLCTGLPPRFRDKPRANGKKPPQPIKADYLHDRLGLKPVTQLIGLGAERWLDVHNWKGGRRAAIQAVKRALNYGVEVGLIEKNPIRGFRVERPRQRTIYFTADQEVAFDQYAKKQLREAIHVCIRTGARPISEFASLQVRHVEETERGQP